MQAGKEPEYPLWRLVFSDNISIWGTAIMGRWSVSLKQRDYPSDYG